MKTIAINDGWRIEGRNFHQGLVKKLYRRDYAIPDGALAVTLPKVAQAALFEAGQLPDPNVGTNSEAYKPAEDQEWWYFRDFEAPQRTASQRVYLRLEGITYRAEVWVNGSLVANIQGMFRVDEIDITDAIDEQGRNRIAIRTRTQEHARQDDRGGTFRGKVRAQGVVQQSMYRWNWCPHLVTVGVWRPVSLVVKDAVEIEDMRVRTLSVQAESEGDVVPAEAPAEIEVTWQVTNRGETDASAKVEYKIVGESFDGETTNGTVDAKVSAGQTVTLTKRIAIKSARLWWCNGLGGAALYNLTSQLRGGASVGSDPRSTTFGVREIRFVHSDDAEWVKQVGGQTDRPWTIIEPMYPWVLVLNGRRVFLKGSNWVVADVLLRLERERYERVLLPAKVGGLNFMRVWGGSLAETDEFYDVCDRYGLLCWQEFWLACENYPALDRAELERCARDTLKRLWNRPSLVFYSGGNEFEPDNVENKSAVDTLARVVAEEDPTREFRRSSPYKGDKHGGLIPTPTMTRTKYLDIVPGDKRHVLFRSEVAVGRSAPMFAQLEKFIPPQWPMDQQLFRHFFGVPSEFLMFAQEYDADDSYTHAVIANHFAHMRVIQVNLEFCRSQMFRCGGHLNWQYSVPWPCLHREIVDWWGVPKPAFYAYVNGCRDLALFVDVETYLWQPGQRIELPVHLVNDGATESDLELGVDIISTTGEVVHAWRQNAGAKANAAAQVAMLKWDVPRDLTGKSLFVVSGIWRGGQQVFQNMYLVATSVHQHDRDALVLDGQWQREDGSTLQLPGNDMTLSDDGFESIVQKSLERDFEQTAEDRDGDVAVKGLVTYRRTFDLPASLRGKKLEFFSRGIEASWEVVINGQSVGKGQIKGSSLDLGAMAHVPHGKDDAQALMDPATDYKFFSDPITLPRLEPVFVDIPDGLLKDSGNEIVLKLKTNCQKTVSQRLEIRERTANRDEVRRECHSGVLFGNLRKMAAADVVVEQQGGELEVHNRGDVPAVMVLLDVEADVDQPAAVALKDNALMMLPGDRRRLGTLTGEPLPDGARVTVRGWNVAEQVVELRGSLAGSL